MTDNELDIAVKQYCDQMQMTVPEPWCYPGDKIRDKLLGGEFICGDKPKDVAEVRRRTLSFELIS